MSKHQTPNTKHQQTRNFQRSCEQPTAFLPLHGPLNHQNPKPKTQRSSKSQAPIWWFQVGWHLQNRDRRPTTAGVCTRQPSSGLQCSNLVSVKAPHEWNLGLKRARILKGFRHSAQGCAARATLGERSQTLPTLKGFYQSAGHRGWESPGSWDLKVCWCLVFGVWCF
jgi:hypothetical protein